MNDQCKFCIHADVCKYKEPYETCEKVKEGANYPFISKIDCVHFISSVQSAWEARESMKKQSMTDQCKFCVLEDICPYKEHYEDEVKLYEKLREKCENYPVFKFELKCSLFTIPKNKNGD